MSCPFAHVRACIDIFVLSLIGFVEPPVSHLSQFPLCLSPLCFVFEFCVLSLGLENRATCVSFGILGLPLSPTVARKLFTPSPRFHTIPTTLVRCYAFFLSPATRIDTSHVSCPGPFVHVLHILSSSYRTHPTFFDRSPISLKRSLGRASKLFHSFLVFSPPSLVVGCVFLAPLFLRVQNSQRLSFYISTSPLPLLSHVCANTLLPLIPLSLYSRSGFFLCNSPSPFPHSVVHCPYLAFFSFSFSCHLRIPFSFSRALFLVGLISPRLVTISLDVLTDSRPTRNDHPPLHIDYYQSMSVERSMPPLHIYVFSLTL